MTPPDYKPTEPDQFIERWKESGGAERANYQMFLTELCKLLGVPSPDPATEEDAQNDYVFEKTVVFRAADGSTSSGFIDLYKRGCFVLEAKQGSERKDTSDEALSKRIRKRKRRRKSGTAVRGTGTYDDAMVAARGQAESYAKALPTEHGWPPFIIVVDVGHSIELFADFSGTGKNYSHFPDRQNFRIHLDELADETTRELLQAVWTEPHELDPSRHSAAVTKDIAAKLARLAKSLEAEGHDPERTAHFLMRCLFTMFAEDVGLLPEDCFTRLLVEDVRPRPGIFVPMLKELWQAMDKGGFSPVIKDTVLRFNGGLFDDHTTLPLSEDQIELLIEASEADWSQVEPAIFGTMLERALDPKERHRLGAHYTPRAYVERLVIPTIMDPLRDEWTDVQAAVLHHRDRGEAEEARELVREFHQRLCKVQILDPACGTGNFLYVSLEHLKRLEGEVLQTLEDFGDTQANLEMQGLTVSPEQFHGIEINPRAAAIAELVLWIGYLQWHFRTRGRVMPPEPVLKDFHNIEHRDAVLDYDEKIPLVDDEGQPVTRWDGESTVVHPATGEEVPDDDARVPVYEYVNPRKAEWPSADFVVGNPPFVNNREMRKELGDGYVEALSKAYPEIKEAADFVMNFWFLASQKILGGSTTRFGLITTNSIRMLQNRGVVHRAINSGLSVIFAVPDHPWPQEGAKVRVSMTVAARTEDVAELAEVYLAPTHDQVATNATQRDLPTDDVLEKVLTGKINPDLTWGVDVSELRTLQANKGLSSAGMKPYAQSLLITDEQAEELFADSRDRKAYAPPYRNGMDVARKPRGLRVIDVNDFEEDEVRKRFPRLYQYLCDFVKPERSQTRNKKLRREFWRFEATRSALRAALEGLDRYIVTVENSPERYFTFLSTDILPDQKLRVTASDDAYLLAVLSSRLHEVFARRTGGRTGVANTPVYNSGCYKSFPFPDASPETEQALRALGEELHETREQQLSGSSYGLTDLYNVVVLTRRDEPLSEEMKDIYRTCAAGTIARIHDQIDELVFDAYGWPHDLSDEEILQRLVDLNAVRAAEEERGLIRYLRPEFQKSEDEGATQVEVGLELGDVDTDAAVAEVRDWPKGVLAQSRAVREALNEAGKPLDTESLARRFRYARRDRVDELLHLLADMGQAREVEGGRFVA